MRRALWGTQEAVCGPHGDNPGQYHTPLYREYCFKFEDHPTVWFRFVFLALSIGFAFETEVAVVRGKGLRDTEC